MASDASCEVCGAERGQFLLTEAGTSICSNHLKTGKVRFKRDESGEILVADAEGNEAPLSSLKEGYGDE